MIPTTTTQATTSSDPVVTAPPRVVTPPPELASLREILGLGGKAIPARSAPPLVVGHRGNLYQALENTRPGFLLCAEMGCDFVELDVFKVCMQVFKELSLMESKDR